jgi:hypothetical protein
LYHDSRWLDERTAQQKYRALKKLVEMLDHGYQGWFLEKLGEMKEPASR